MTQEHMLEPSGLDMLRKATGSHHSRFATSEYRARLGGLARLYESLESAVARVALPEYPAGALRKSTDLRSVRGASDRDLKKLDDAAASRAGWALRFHLEQTRIGDEAASGANPQVPVSNH